MFFFMLVNKVFYYFLIDFSSVFNAFSRISLLPMLSEDGVDVWIVTYNSISLN